MELTVILIEPENPGNTGAICRAMKNFDFENLLLIGPKFSLRSSELRNRAKWANDLVDNIESRKYNKNSLKKLKKEFDYLIATTARVGRDYNVLRIPVTPEQLAERMVDLEKSKSRIGILIGREGSGLNNEEISSCDFSTTIPTSKKYGTMNISHATTIILYEIFKRLSKTKNKGTIISHINPITEKEKQQLMKLLDQAMDNMHFLNEKKKDTQRTVWKKLIGKTFLSRREAYALMGFLKKIR